MQLPAMGRNVFYGDGIVSAVACLALLLMFVQGCRTPGPPRIAKDVRASLGAVGVYSVGPPPNASLPGTADVRRAQVKGAAKGGGIGLLSGLGGGALTGAGVGLACGPFAWICSPVYAALGAAVGGAGGLVVGSTIGAVKSRPNADAAETARAAISAALTGRDIQGDMRRRIVDVGRSEAANLLDLGANDAVAPAPTPHYGPLAERGAHAVLEVGIVQVALTGDGGGNPDLVLKINARARLITIPENDVLWTDDQLTFESSEAKLSEWTAEDSRLLKSELDRGLDILARRIASAFTPRA